MFKTIFKHKPVKEESTTGTTKYYTIRDYRFEERISSVMQIRTLMFYKIVFDAVDGDETAKQIVDTILELEGYKEIKDADGKVIYKSRKD